MTGRLTPMNDDHGDQFPGAVPAARAAVTPRHTAADERTVRMHAAYVQKANSLVEAGRESLAHELADVFAQEFAGAGAASTQRTRARRVSGRGTPSRSAGDRRPGRADTCLGRFTRTSLRRFDRYTLDVFNPGAPSRPQPSER